MSQLEIQNPPKSIKCRIQTIKDICSSEKPFLTCQTSWMTLASESGWRERLFTYGRLMILTVAHCVVLATGIPFHVFFFFLWLWTMPQPTPVCLKRIEAEWRKYASPTITYAIIGSDNLIMACRLAGDNPLSETMLEYCWLNPWEEISVKS